MPTPYNPSPGSSGWPAGSGVFDAPPAPAAPARPAAKPGNDDALFAYLSSKGPVPPEYEAMAKVLAPQVAAAPGAQDFLKNPGGQTVPLLNASNPASVQAPPAARPPAGGQPLASPAPGIATAPGDMPPPLAVMPQLYNQQQMDKMSAGGSVEIGGGKMYLGVPNPNGGETQYQKLANGMYVDRAMAGAANHALGLDRLPSFDEYAKTHNSGLPGRVITGGGPAMDAMYGGYDPGQQQAALLKQYLGLQAGQSQGDQDATQRMGVAGNLGVAQGQLGLQQQKQGYEQGQGIRDAASLAVLQGGMSNPNMTPEAFNQGIRNVNRLFPGGQQPGAPAPAAQPVQGAEAQPPAGGQPQPANGLTGSEQLLGPDLAAKMASAPELKGASPSAKLDYILSQPGHDEAWAQKNWPALQGYLSEGYPGAIDQLRASSRAGVLEQILRSPGTVFAGLMNPPATPQTPSFWSQQGRRNLAAASETPFGELVNGATGQPSQHDRSSMLLRKLLP